MVFSTLVTSPAFNKLNDANEGVHHTDVQMYSIPSQTIYHLHLDLWHSPAPIQQIYVMSTSCFTWWLLPPSTLAGKCKDLLLPTSQHTQGLCSPPFILTRHPLITNNSRLHHSVLTCASNVHLRSDRPAPHP